MAVMQNSLIFGGVDSADFGIYIGGEGTFNAPKRDVEMIKIPGRNGAFALDKGRFENIEVTYSAFNYETDLATFAQQLSDFRNAICSQKGYQRLTDTFHLDEYRMATYIDGLEIKPIDFNTAATFDIVFNCKPQRYLLDGEEAIDVSSGDVILNPTLFDASPLLAVKGYGTIGFNGYEIELENKTVGDVGMLSNYTSPSGGSANNTVVFTATLENTALLNAGDAITIGTVSASYTPVRSGGSTVTFTGAAVNSSQNFDSCTASIVGGRDFEILATMRNVAFVYGTASSSATGSASVTLTYNNTSTTKTLTLKLDYDGDKTITITATGQGVTSSWYIGKNIKIPSIYGNSSQSALGHPTYIDCDLGEAYLIDSGIPVSLNPYIDLGSDLPKLASGTNVFTLDNTITELKLTPRWWKV